MKRLCIGMATLFAVMSVCGVVTLEAKEPKVGGETLVFALQGLDGSTVRSSDRLFREKVVLVTLWGTWCPPCRSEAPTFVELQERYRDAGLVVVGIAFERDVEPGSRRQRLREFSQKHNLNYLILDGGHTSEFSDALPMVTDVEGLPIEILIDRSGKVVKSRNGYGYKKKWARKLEKELRELLAEEPAAASP